MKMLFLFLASMLQTTSPSSITDSITDYKEVCLQAASSEKVFSTFKSYPVYQEALEISNYNLGRLFAEKIVHDYPSLLPELSILRKNDLYGGPLTYDFPVVGIFSPATLRYITIAGDILDLFSFSEPPRIVEIGVGYGGQCYILNALTQIKQYTLIDLPSVLPLAGKYLDRLEIRNVELLEPTKIKPTEKYDLFISNYAFSECNRSVQLRYFDDIIRHSANGYVLFNNISSSWNIDSLSLSEFVDLLEAECFIVNISREEPSTNLNNYLITWVNR